MGRVTGSPSDVEIDVPVETELLRVLESLPYSVQEEVLDFARFLAQRAGSRDQGQGAQDAGSGLFVAPADTLRALTAIVDLGGDAVLDTEALYDDNGHH